MRTTNLCGCLSTAFLLLSALGTAARGGQTPDTVAQPGRAGHELQFQLIGGLGVNYLTRVDPTSSWRVGVDAQLSLSSSTSNNNHEYLSSNGSSMAGQVSGGESTSKPVAYKVTGSFVWLWNSHTILHTSLYGGLGPMLSYEYSKSESRGTTTYQSLGSTGSQSQTNAGELKSHTRSAGLLAVLGVQCRVAEPISLTAEYELSAAYEWGWSGYANVSSSVYDTPTLPYNSRDNSNTERHGWDLALNSIRLGVVVSI